MKEMKEMKENKNMSTTILNVDSLIEMTTLCLQVEEMLCQKRWKAFQFCTIRVKSLKKKMLFKMPGRK